MAGEDAIKEHGEAYLPKPSGMDKTDYTGYLSRAQFFNAAGRTLDGLAGMVGRKPVIWKVPEGMEKYLDNVDGKGHSLDQFIQMCVKDTLTTGWGGVLVDMPSGGGGVSQRDFEENGLYAYMIYYKAEDCANWRWQTDGRRQSLSFVILQESVDVDKGNYASELKTYYRVCELGAGGNYRQTLYDDTMNPISETEPKNSGGNFKNIPFAFLSTASGPDEPLLNDLINVNLSHYKKSADAENCLHMAGIPTPYERGWTPETEIDANGNEYVKSPMKLGGTQFLYFPAGTEQVAFLEYSGSGYNSIAKGMETDEERMAILGARIIAQQKKGVEAAETAKIHNAAENSVLAAFARSLSSIFSRLLWIYLEWSTGQKIPRDDVSVELNTDYDVSTMSPAELTALVSLWQSGGISHSTLFKNLKEGELVDADKSLDDELAEIGEEQTARMPAMIKGGES